MHYVCERLQRQGGPGYIIVAKEEFGGWHLGPSLILVGFSLFIFTRRKTLFWPLFLLKVHFIFRVCHTSQSLCFSAGAVALGSFVAE